MTAPADTRARLYADMDPANLTPLWESLHTLVPREPRSPCVPALWRYDAVRQIGRASCRERV